MNSHDKADIPIVNAVSDDEVFADGNMTPVVRRGDEVRRTRSPWWRASAAVLNHLENEGFERAPQLLGYEGETERLTFMRGESAPASLEGFENDDVLISIGRMIRSYHDAMRTFVDPGNIVWPVMVGVPKGDGTICHNDIAPWNTIFRELTPVALIDWDLVAPGTRAWDLAYAAWRFAPLYPDEHYGSPAERLRRISVLLDAYELPIAERSDFIPLIRARMHTSYETVEVWGKRGVPGFEKLYREKMHVDALECIRWLEAYLLRPGE